MVAPIAAAANACVSSLDRVIGRGVRDEPRLATIVGGRDVQIPHAWKGHALVVSHRPIVSRAEERHGCAAGITGCNGRKDRVIDSGERTNIDTRTEGDASIV